MNVMNNGIAKVGLAAVALASAYCAAAKNEIKGLAGVWTDGRTELTFKGDTLFVDDLGNEGFAYSCVEDSVSKTVTAKSLDFEPDTFRVKVVRLDSKTLTLKYTDDDKSYSFRRKKVQIPAMGL